MPKDSNLLEAISGIPEDFGEVPRRKADWKLSLFVLAALFVIGCILYAIRAN